jgi:pimeloyl-ACP methyl ester carboxylesterase
MRFVLVHMSCAGAWAWGEVPVLLRAAGHDVLAPDLHLSAGQTPSSHAEAVAALCEGDDPVVVAGHSYGGMVVPVLADLLRSRVRALVVVDGLVPDPGDSSFAIRPHAVAERRAAARAGGGLFPPPADVDPRLVPMPVSAFETPVEFSAVDVPHVFVWCARSDMGEQAARAGERGWRVVSVDAGHWLPLEAPAVCAGALLEAYGNGSG